MALKPLNSVGGFSVGEIPANVILSNADITVNNGTFSGNLLISNATASWGVLTDNLYYSNGTPWDFQQAAGSNGELQFNMGDDFAASPNLTFDNTTQLFTVTGNANITGTLSVGALEVDEIFNGNSNVAIPVANGNVNISVSGNANVLVVTGTGANVNGYLDVSGNATVANLRLDDGTIESLGTSGVNVIPANATAGITLYGNVAPNANVAFDLGGASKNWANIYSNNIIIAANVTSGNANLGNALLANYGNFNFDLGVTQTVFAANLVANVSANVSNIQVANFVVSNLTPATDDQYYLGNTLKRWKELNISGNANIGTLNVTANGSFGNLEFGNLLTGNYATFDNDIQVLGNIANANHISVTNSLAANTGNFSGNIQTLNANLGNLATANYINVAQNVDINGSLDATNANFVGNLYIDPSGLANYGIKTDHLYYANGTPWDLQEAAGNNNEIQFNLNDNFAASANFTFDPSTNLLTVNGNANVTNTLLTPNVNSGSGNLTLTSNGYNSVFENNGNVTFPGNVMAGTFYGNVNANITVTAANTSVLYSDNGLISGASGFTFDKTSNLFSTPGNLDVADHLNVTSNANINGVIISQTTILGDGNGIQLRDDVNGAQLNYNNLNYIYVDTNGASLEANAFIATLDTDGNFALPNNLSVVGNIANVNNISVTNNVAAVTGNFSGNVTANNFTTSGSGGNITGANVVSANTFTGNLEATYANVSGNIDANNVTVNLELDGNTANFSGNVVFNGANVTVGNALLGNTANFSGNAVFNGGNVTVGNALLGNTANFTGNVLADNIAANGNVTANYINANANVLANYVNVNLELSGNTANFIGNVILSGAQVTVNNHLSGNTANFIGNAVFSGGNVTVNNALLGNTANFIGNVLADNIAANGNVTANYINANANIIANNLSVNLDLSGNTANFIGNVTLSGPNVTVNNYLSGNIANFSGNITSLNANLGNIADANFVRSSELYNGNSNVRIAPNGNVTVSATGVGDVLTVSNVGANVVGYVHANGNGTFGAVYSNTVTAQGGNLTIYAAAGDNYVELRPTGNGHVDVGNFRIQNLGAPSAQSDAATKQYVDDVAQGLNVHDSALAATANTLANLTGGTITYNNGTAGVGANLVLSGSPTANYLSANAFDGNVTAVVGSRILVKSEANAAHNGVYVVDSSTVLTRASDYNSVPEVEAGDFIFVQDGDTYNDSGWVQTSVVTTMGTDPIVFTQFSGAGTYQAGQGLTLTGTVFSVNVDNITTEIAGGNVVVKANAQLTTPNIGAATGTSLDLTGNVLANNLNSNNKVTAVDFEASGNIIAANISANANLVVSNATINLELAGNTANFSGNVVVPNLTVNTTLSGNIANFSGNITAANANLGNLATANYVNVANLLTTVDANVTGTLTVANANIGGNITVNNLTVNLELAGNTANFSGNVVVPNLTVNTTLSGNIANFSGNITAANANLGNLATANYVNVTSNVTTSNLTVNNEISGNTANFSGNVVFNGANVTVGNALLGNTANFSGNVVVPNLTVNLALAGNTANFSGNVDMQNWLSVSNTANVGNLRTDNLLYANGQPWDFQLPAGSNTQIQYNDGAGSFGASANFTFDYLNNILTVTGNANVSQTLNGNVGNFSGNMTVNNLLANGVANVGNLHVQANVTSALNPNANLTLDLGTSTQRWSNVYAGNIDASGNLTLGGNISANNFTANILTANIQANIGPTQIIYGNVTTSNTDPSQTIATVSITGVTGIEWLVKGYDEDGLKYSMAVVTAVTDGSAVDYSTFGTVNLNGVTGSLAVNMVGSNVELQVTPSSSNTTHWITQFRTI
jgi:hypothetical protein